MFALTGDATGLIKRASLRPAKPVTKPPKFGTQAKGNAVRCLTWTSEDCATALAGFESGALLEVSADLDRSRIVASDCGAAALAVAADHTSGTAWICDADGTIRKAENAEGERFGLSDHEEHTEDDHKNQNEGANQIAEQVFAMDAPLSCAQFDIQGSFVVGGGEENDVQLWDFRQDEAKRIFQAKNVKHDFLNLRVPVWPTAIAFHPADSAKLLSVSAHHHVRMYDTKAQRRPVIDFGAGERRLTSLVFTHDDHSALAGNVTGEVLLLDLRRQKVVRRYKGIGGSVRDLCMHPTRSVFAAASLDRWLAFYDTNDRNPLDRVYLKQQLTCTIFSKALPKKKKKKASDDRNGEESSIKKRKKKAEKK